MKKYLLTWLLGLVSFLGFAQGDIPIKESVVAPSNDFVRPVLRPSIGEIQYRKADGTYWNGRKGRDPKLFYTWPPVLIQNPQIGDQAMGPALTADTTVRQYAIFNGAKWIYYGESSSDPTSLVFGSAFTRIGNTIDLVQTPNSLGDRTFDRIRIARSPDRIDVPGSHSFLFYNSYTGIVERLSYTAYLETLLGIFDSRYSANSGNNGSGGFPSWGNIPETQDSPGKLGEQSFKNDTLYLYAYKNAFTTQWFGIPVISQFSNQVVKSGDRPTITRSLHNPSTGKITTDWTYTGTDVTSWDVFVSFGQDHQYQLLKSGIPAGDRSFAFDAVSGISDYYIVVRGQKTGGKITDFSDPAARVQIVAQEGYKQVIDVKLVPQNWDNSIRVDFYSLDGGGIATIQMATNPNASVTSDDYWTTTATVDIPRETSYSYTFAGIKDLNARYIRIWRSGGNKTPSAKAKYGPVALSSLNNPLNTPQITSVSNITSTTATLNLNFNNSGVVKAWVYQSLASPQDFYRTEIPVTSNSYTATGLQPGTKYQFHIQVMTMENGAEKYSSNSTPETELTTSGSSQAIPTPTISNGMSVSTYSGNYARIQYAPTSTEALPASWEYRVGSGAWTAGESGIVSNYFQFLASNQVHAGLTVRYRVRYKRVSDGQFGLYSNVLKVVFGSNFGNNNNWSDFTTATEAADQTPVTTVPPSESPLSLSVVSQSNTTLNLKINNPDRSGEILYNWSIYTKDYKAGGQYICNLPNISSSGTLGIDLSGCNLTPGVEYWAYVAVSNGPLQNQLRENYVKFTRITAPSGSGNDIIIFGNSITQHGPSTEVNWSGNWGMAASSADKDYVHIFENSVKALNGNNTVSIGNAYLFETTYDQNFNFAGIQQQVAGKEVVYIRLGDNVDNSTVVSRNLSSYLSTFIDYCRAANPNVKIILSTSFIQGKGNYNQLVNTLASQKTQASSKIVVADFTQFSSDPAYIASNHSSGNAAVRMHPNDAGMAMIAESSLNAYKDAFLDQTDDSGPPNPARPGRAVTASRVSNFQGLGEVIILSTPYAKAGIGMQYGGSLVYYSDMSGTDQDNIVNNHDKGRQIQQSWYAGPQPFAPAGVQKHSSDMYANFPWNPVQAGDIFYTPGRIDGVEMPSAANDWTLRVTSYAYNWAFNAYKGGPDGNGDHTMISEYKFIDDDLLQVRYKIITKRVDGWTHEMAIDPAQVPNWMYPQERSEAPAIILERKYDKYWGNPTETQNAGPILFNTYDPNKPIPVVGGYAPPGTPLHAYFGVKDYWINASTSTDPNVKGLGLFAIDYETEKPCNCYMTTAFGITDVQGSGYQGFSMSYMNFGGVPQKLYGMNATAEYTFGVGYLSPHETKAKYLKWGQPFATGRQ